MGRARKGEERAQGESVSVKTRRQGERETVYVCDEEQGCIRKRGEIKGATR